MRLSPGRRGCLANVATHQQKLCRERMAEMPRRLKVAGDALLVSQLATVAQIAGQH
jgi:hypothetical protein